MSAFLPPPAMPSTNTQMQVIPASTARWKSSCGSTMPGSSTGQRKNSNTAPAV